MVVVTSCPSSLSLTDRALDRADKASIRGRRQEAKCDGARVFVLRVSCSIAEGCTRTCS